MLATSENTGSLKLDTNSPFAILVPQGDGENREAVLLQGAVSSFEHLHEIPRRTGKGHHTLSMVPYRQAADRGLEVREDEARIRCMTVEQETRLSVEHLVALLPSGPVNFQQAPTFDQTPKQYAQGVERVIEEICKGNACNVVLSMEARGLIEAMTPETVLKIFRSILEREFGAYLTFLFFDGAQYHVGASPERHLTVRQNAEGGTVAMNPISGTFRKVDGSIDPEAFRQFLLDGKEINELFMCVDEELKLIARMSTHGGSIVGPNLKEMARVVHTEYTLIGHIGPDDDPIELLRQSMHAPTVTGSPQQSAVRIINMLEPGPRGYYAGEIVMMGEEPDGTRFLDSAIAIRTLLIAPDGRVFLRVGASLVRDSDPLTEAMEVHAKAAGVLRALEQTAAPAPSPQLPDIMNEDLLELLTQRNANLNRFLIEDQEGSDHGVTELQGKKIVIVHCEDDFAYMLSHMLHAMGAEVEVVPFDVFHAEDHACDLAVMGPGPGDPCDRESPKMRAVHAHLQMLRQRGIPIFGICLGHQILCKQLGFSVEPKLVPSQGVQEKINLFGSEELVGFYNTFAARVHGPMDGIDVCADPDTGFVHAIRGSDIASVQFHAESILSQNGMEILKQEFSGLMRRHASSRST